jgi:hypothetical protein
MIRAYFGGASPGVFVVAGESTLAIVGVVAMTHDTRADDHPNRQRIDSA